MTDLLEEITETNPMQREFNKGMMVAYINRDIVSRSHLDVRKSYVYYDADKDFKLALANELEGPGVDQELLDKVGIKYWSKGIV